MSTQPHDTDRQFERRDERADKPRIAAIMSGLIVIGVGVVFLLENLGWFRLAGNWWALFILIPVFVMGGSAWSRYQRLGYWDRGAVTTLTASLFPLAVALIFLLDLNWGVVWPIFPIIAGVLLLTGAVVPAQRQ